MPGNKYIIKYLPFVVKEDIPKLQLSAKNLIQKAIEERLTLDPIGFGKPLRYSLKGHRRLRISDYRVIYKIDSINQTVIIIAIKHRKDVYDEF